MLAKPKLARRSTEVMVFETDMDEMILEKEQKVAHFNRSPRWPADLRKSVRKLAVDEYNK